MAGVRDLLKIKWFFSGERRAMESIAPPEDFAARIEKLAADYALREQAIPQVAPPPAPVKAAAPVQTATPLKTPILNQRYRKTRRFSPAFAFACSMAALIVCAIGLALPGNSDLPERFSGLVEIKAAYAAGGGIGVNQGFVISASQPLAAELVEKSLRLYPEFSYQLEMADDSTYLVLPTQPLAENTVYHLSFDPERVQEDKPMRAEYSWSFQTEPAFSFLDISPSNTALDVPAAAPLTLTFNKEVGAEAADFIIIEPAIAGVWQANGQNLVFLPDNGWSYATVYTVSIAAGLPAMDGSTLTENHKCRFHSEAPPPPPLPPFAFDLQVTEEAFRPEDIPSWPVTEQVDADDSPYIVELYELADAAAFAQLLRGSVNEYPPLPEAEVYETTPLLAEEGELTLSLGYNLPPGFYLARFSKQGCERQAPFQISALTAYVKAGMEERLFWLHDETGQPLAGASITRWPDALERGYSDEQGVAILPAVPTAERLIYCLEAGGQALVLSVADPDRPPQPPQGCWRAVLYTDQPYYSPGQTLRFFGVCQPCSDDGEDEAVLSARLKGAGIDTPLPYALEVAPGAFDGQLLLPGLRDGWYELALYADESYIGGVYIEVGPPRSQAEIQPQAEAETEIGTAIETEASKEAETTAETAAADAKTISLLAGEPGHRYLPGQPVKLGLYQNGEPLQPFYGESALFVLSGPRALAYTAGEQAQTIITAAGHYPAEFCAWAVFYADGEYYSPPSLPLIGVEQPLAQLTASYLTDEEGEGTPRLLLSLSDAQGLPLAASLQVYLSEEPLTRDDFAAMLNGEHKMGTPVPRSAGDSTALFATVTTDDTGLAELEWDSVLAQSPWVLGWRAYAPQQDLAASGSLEVDFRPPLGIASRFAGSFAEGDAPVLRLDALGTEIMPGDEVNYHIALAGLGFKHSVKALTGQWCEIRLPSLPAGDYELLVSATSGALHAVESLPFTVQPPQQGAYALLQHSLTEGFLPFSAGEEPATLIFSSRGKADALSGLFDLVTRDAARLDHKLAALTAARLLQEDFGWREATGQVQTAQLPLYQREDGALAALPLAAADKTLSALAAPLVQPGINREALAAYLRQCYAEAEDPQDKALALYGLAGLRQPVLLDIGQMLAEQPEEQARLYLALAYFASGHGAAAKALVVELLPYYEQQEEVDAGIQAYLALLATIFELPEAGYLAAALPAPDAAGYAQVLAQAQILAARCQSLPPNGFLSYQLDGRLHQIRLREHGHYILPLTPRELSALRFSDVAGDVVLSIIRYQEDNPPLLVEGPVAVSRRYQGTEVILEFSLPAEAPPGYYRVDDTLPAGLRFSAIDHLASSRRLWLLGEDGHHISFIIRKGAGRYHGNITYITNVQTPGSYVAAAPRLRALNWPEIAATGEAQMVEVE